jgi:hypothetical protein
MFNGRKRSYNPSESNRRAAGEEDKVKRYVHKPFTVEHSDTITASGDRDGKVTITVQEKGKEEYDQVTIPASCIFNLAQMLTDTRKVRWMDRAEVEAMTAEKKPVLEE